MSYNVEEQLKSFRSNRQASFKAILPRFLHYLRPFWKLTANSLTLSLISALVGLLGPWPMKIIIDNVLQNHQLHPTLLRFLGPLANSRFALLLTGVVALLAVTLIQNGVRVLQGYNNTKLNQGMVLSFRSDLFRHVQRLSLAFHDHRRAGKLMYVMNAQAAAISNLAIAIPPLTSSAIALVGMFLIVFYINWQLALISMTVVPLLYYSVGYYVKHIQKRMLIVRNMEAETLSIINESMGMQRVTVAFGREDYEHNRFHDQSERANSLRLQLTVRQTMFAMAVNMTTAVGTALVLGFGAYYALQGQITVGQLLVVMAYVASVYKPLEAISTTVGSLQGMMVNLQMAFAVLDIEPEIKDTPGAVSIDRAKGRITFEGVCFDYKRRVNTLKNISFEAQPGQVVAIVGYTGAGKTTLISLIPRFYDPQQGRILIDGIDIRNVTIKSLRQQISIVLQESLLFSDTIANNIRYGRLDASMEEIIAAAKAANVHDFIMGLPDQYETEIGESGTQFSGGERQRIAVARAFLKDAPILILDEPTSSIDSKTEAVILDALERLMVGRTTFMVAHRLSTIRNADMILVLNHGELVEGGTHDELLQQDGIYRQLYDMQSRRAVANR